MGVKLLKIANHPIRSLVFICLLSASAPAQSISRAHRDTVRGASSGTTPPTRACADCTPSAALDRARACLAEFEHLEQTFTPASNQQVQDNTLQQRLRDATGLGCDRQNPASCRYSNLAEANRVVSNLPTQLLLPPPRGCGAIPPDPVSLRAQLSSEQSARIAEQTIHTLVVIGMPGIVERFSRARAPVQQITSTENGRRLMRTLRQMGRWAGGQARNGALENITENTAVNATTGMDGGRAIAQGTRAGLVDTAQEMVTPMAYLEDDVKEKITNLFGTAGAVGAGGMLILLNGTIHALQAGDVLRLAAATYGHWEVCIGRRAAQMLNQAGDQSALGANDARNANFHSAISSSRSCVGAMAPSGIDGNMIQNSRLYRQGMIRELRERIGCSDARIRSGIPYSANEALTRRVRQNQLNLQFQSQCPQNQNWQQETSICALSTCRDTRHWLQPL